MGAARPEGSSVLGVILRVVQEDEVMGGSEGRLHVYDIGDMAIPRETEWTDLQKSIANFAGAGAGAPELESSTLRTSINGR